MNTDELPQVVTVQGVYDTVVGPIRNGGNIRIWKDKTTRCDKEFVPMVIAAGGHVVDTEGEINIIVELPMDIEEETDHSRLINACVELILTNEVRNFTRTGRPRIEAIRDMVDFKVTTEALRDAYEEALQSEGINNDGDQSRERSDEGIDPAA